MVVAACGDGTTPPPPDGPPVASVIVSPDTASRRAGETVQMTATLRDSAGAELTDRAVTWTSSAPAIAAVDESGAVTLIAPGTAIITAASEGITATSRLTVWVPEVLVGAGDIAECASSGAPATAALLDDIPGTVFTVGDNAYPNGSDADYANCYHPHWGRHRARTRPVAGNHEYYTPGAEGYFNYFGAAAGERGKGYYSFDLGMWHVVMLNSTLLLGDPGGEQVQWLRDDLAATSRRCVMAVWHHPRWSSGSNHGSEEWTSPFWDALYEAGADVVVVGHDHLYERFAPQRPDGTVDRSLGIRQFTVGTGGASLYEFEPTPLPASEVRGLARGVIKFTLRDVDYDWQFIPVAGASFTDSGRDSCH
jgi:hypothetical protein